MERNDYVNSKGGERCYILGTFRYKDLIKTDMIKENGMISDIVGRSRQATCGRPWMFVSQLVANFESCQTCAFLAKLEIGTLMPTETRYFH
jgi:hypothetical protein